MKRFELGSRMLLVATCVGGCNGDPGSLADGSSGVETSAGESSDGGSSSTLDPAEASSSEASSDDDGSSSDSGTTGEGSTASARFIVRARKGEGELYDPALLVYEDGVLSDPVPLSLELAGSRAVLGASLGVVGEQAHYCATDVPLANVQCFVRAIDGGAFGLAQPFNVGLLAAPSVLSLLPSPAATVGYASVAALPDSDAPSIYFTSMWNEQLLQSPRVLVESTPELRIASALSLSPDGAWLAYSALDLQGVAHPFVVSTLELIPTSVAIGEPPVSGETIAFVQWLPDSSGLVYRIDQDDAAGDDALYVQALGADAPAPLRLDDADDARSKGSLTVAPDSHALTYVATDGIDGSLVFVALGDAGPETPIEVHDEHTESFWSSDSRRLAYWARDVSGAPDYRVLDAAGDTPELAFTLREAMPGSVPRSARFDPVQRRMYVIANQYDSGEELFRIDISGDGPGEPQRVSAALPEGTDVAPDYVVAANGSRVLYRADTGEVGVHELFAVDISGPDPSAAVRIDVPSREGTEVRYPQLSPNGSVATYHEVEYDEPWMLNMVDLDQPSAPVLLSRDAMGVLFVDG